MSARLEGKRGTRIGRRAVIAALSGAVGTSAMDLLLYVRYRRAGGRSSPWQWEAAEGVTGWDTASAPGQLGAKVERLVVRRPPPDGWARTTTNVVHWATGIGWGVQYGVLAGRPSKGHVARALALGPVVWLSGYAVLPLAGVYKPIWKYDSRTLAQDLSAHMVYGATVIATFAALTRGPRA
jgi:hypothetical protein